MFTGLIEETGKIAGLRKLKDKHGNVTTRISVSASKTAKELKVGDSVAVSGVCLTAVDVKRKEFSAELAQETLERTSLASLKKGSLVNLELPARPQDRLGGHIVQGHVDGTGQLLSLTKIKDRDDWRMVINLPATLARYVVPQGSIAVEGISLTVAAVHAGKAEIAIIPHTYEVTNLHALRAGDAVNIEADILAKYVEQMTRKDAPGKLTVSDLIRQGF